MPFGVPLLRRFGSAVLLRLRTTRADLLPSRHRALDRRPHVRWALGDFDAGRTQSRDLVRRSSCAPGDDGTGMSHPFSRRCGAPRDESGDRSGRHQERSAPPRNDDVGQQKQMAQQEEIAGRHKQDGQNDHQGNQRQPGAQK